MKREPGFYWWRANADEPWKVVEIRRYEALPGFEDDPPPDELLFPGCDVPARVEENRGEWGARVNPPETAAVCKACNGNGRCWQWVVGPCKKCNATETVPATLDDKPACDHKGCVAHVTFECTCRRCSREAEDGRFHSCNDHFNSDVIFEKHQRVYPSHGFSMRRIHQR